MLTTEEILLAGNVLHKRMEVGGRREATHPLHPTGFLLLGQERGPGEQDSQGSTRPRLGLPSGSCVRSHIALAFKAKTFPFKTGTDSE